MHGKKLMKKGSTMVVLVLASTLGPGLAHFGSAVPPEERMGALLIGQQASSLGGPGPAPHYACRVMTTCTECMSYGEGNVTVNYRCEKQIDIQQCVLWVEQTVDECVPGANLRKISCGKTTQYSGPGCTNVINPPHQFSRDICEFDSDC